MSIQTTLCYLERDGAYLMLHRTKKKGDINHDKWIGIGGKFEEAESPEECALREIEEETGLRPRVLRYRGIVTFVSNVAPAEYMHLFTACDMDGEPHDCDEGELAWVEKEKVASLPGWEGDRIFLALLAREHPFFSLKLVYRGDSLIEAKLDGKEWKLS